MRTRQFAQEVGFRVEVVYVDPDLFEVSVSAWNGAFGGATDLYVEIGGLAELAAKLAGFPRSPSDAREFVLGAFGREFAGGAASLRFFCIDRAGHAYLESKIESDAESAGVFQVATLVMAVEAAAVDEFVGDLQRLEKRQSGIALLRGRG